MTTLYRPVLIESAEQAASLPQGTIAHRVLEFESTWETITQPEVAMKIGLNAWHSTAVDDDAWDWLDRHLVGWTALVPIEAEEETVLVYADEPGSMWTAETFRFAREARAIADGRPSHLPAVEPRTRLVTSWEEA